VPRASGLDALVWALPVAVFVCATAGLAVAFRRWRRAADTVPTDADRALVDAALQSDSHRDGERG
jgi:cytochrome c-type biogenesis protein CcmH/NrfF